MKRSEQILQAVKEKQAEAYQVTRELETLITMLNEARACEQQFQAEFDAAVKQADPEHVVEDG